MANFSNISNEEALSLLKQYKETNNQKILGELYAPFMQMVLAVGLKYYKSKPKAEDLVMRVYEKITTKAKQHDISNFSSWLYTVAKNECLMDLRKKKREYLTEDFSYQEQFMESQTVMHLFKDNEQEKQLNNLEDCISSLNDEQKHCIKAFYLDNNTYKEIVNNTNFTYNEVKSHIQNGKRNLKLCMQSK